MSIKFGIIGCGRIAERHAEHIRSIGELIAVCDLKQDRLDFFNGRFGCGTYIDYEELLRKEQDIDVISICTPNALHPEHTVKALQEGFHVLCEKPMATSVVDAERMINASLNSNRRLFIVKQNRFNPPVQAVKDAIDGGKFGNIFSVQLNCFWNRNPNYYKLSDWKGTLKIDGGTLFTQFSHFIDLLYYFFGDISEAYGFSENFNHQETIEFEDTGVVAIKFYNGILGTINYSVNSYAKNMEGSISIFGENGTVKIGGQYLNELEYQNFSDFEIKDLPPGNPPNNYGEYKGSMSNHDKVYRNVKDVLIKKDVIATNGFEGLKTVEIIQKIYNVIKYKGIMIIVLTFDQPHRKTQDLLYRLLAVGTKPLVVSTEWEERKNFKPIISHRPANPIDINLKTLCKNLGLEFIQSTKRDLYHDLCNIESIKSILLATGNLIEKDIVNKFKVINSHPAYLPVIKGLDALKWAILYNETIGVTTHFVNAEIDGGTIIERREVPIYYEDTFHNLAYRQYELEVEMLVNAINIDPENVTVGESQYKTFRRMPHRLEFRMLDAFERRKQGSTFGL